MDFGANLAPFSLPKSTKILPKTDPRSHQFFDRFLDGFFIHFGSNLWLNLEPCWPLFRVKHGEANWGEGVFCWVFVFFAFWAHGPMGYPPWASILGPRAHGVPPLGLDFEGFWFHFGAKLALCWIIWGARLGYLALSCDKIDPKSAKMRQDGAYERHQEPT